MLVVLGNEAESGSTLYFICEGCKKRLEVKVNGSTHTHDDAIEAAKQRGWCRRLFTEAVHPWFCSQNCASNSDQAKYWAEIWKPMRPKNMTLYMIRHGESIRNLQPHLIGQDPEEPLSYKGEQQAKLLGEYFRDHLIKFNTINASPYKRALDTCLIACEQFDGKLDTIVPELREYSAGDMKGHDRNKLSNEMKAEMTAKGMSFKWPNGESLYEVEARAAGWLEQICMNAKENDVIAFFSHGMTIKCLVHYLMKFEQRLTWRLKLDNTGICKFEMKDGLWFIHTINDTRHLEHG